jgi:hypothetical protein
VEVGYFGPADHLGGFAQEFCHEISATVTTSGVLPTFGPQMSGLLRLYKEIQKYLWKDSESTNYYFVLSKIQSKIPF